MLIIGLFYLDFNNKKFLKSLFKCELCLIKKISAQIIHDRSHFCLLNLKNCPIEIVYKMSILDNFYLN